VIIQAEIVRKLRRVLRSVIGRSGHETDARISGLVYVATAERRRVVEAVVVVDSEGKVGRLRGSLVRCTL